jgi:ABC-type glycerol-3-phosphate transport system substrate-binding protein
MTDREPAFQELAKRYEASTGIKVKFELYPPSDAYSQKVRSAAQGANLPDIFGVLGEKRDFASFVKAGLILDLTPYMDEAQGAWRDSLYPNALAVNLFTEENSYEVKPGIYGVPLDIMAIELVYNKKLLRQFGLGQPQDLAEFVEAGRKISAANAKAGAVQGFVSGWSELWMIDCFANNYALNIMGKDKLIATIKGAVSYTDPDWIKVFCVFRDLRDSGIFAKGLVTMINKTAEQLFASEKAVFAFNGSWCVNVYKGMNPKLEYGVMPLPRTDKSRPMAIWAGAGSSFMVNARAKNKEEAVGFLRWLTDAPQQAYLSQATNNLPANKHCLGNILPIQAEFFANMDYATHPNAWDVSEFSAVTEAIDKGIQSIIIGEKTPEQVASEVQKVKERELAKRS